MCVVNRASADSVEWRAEAGEKEKGEMFRRSVCNDVHIYKIHMKRCWWAGFSKSVLPKKKSRGSRGATLYP